MRVLEHFTAVYEVRMTAAGANSVQRVRLVVRLPDWRMDTEKSDGSISTSLVKDGNYYQCGDGVCIRIAGLDKELPERFLLSRALDRLRSEYAQIGDGTPETVRGHPAVCYRFGPTPRPQSPDPPDYYFSDTACFDDRGILVREVSRGGSAVVFVTERDLIDFSETVAVAAFSLPFEVTSTVEISP